MWSSLIGKENYRNIIKTFSSVSLHQLSYYRIKLNAVFLMLMMYKKVSDIKNSTDATKIKTIMFSSHSHLLESEHHKPQRKSKTLRTSNGRVVLLNI